MTLDETIERYTNNAEYERTHGNLQGCLEFRQLAEWLRDYKRLKAQEPVLDKIRTEIETLPKTYPFINHIDTYVKEDDVKRIIDKYRNEASK